MKRAASTKTTKTGPRGSRVKAAAKISTVPEGEKVDASSKTSNTTRRKQSNKRSAKRALPESDTDSPSLSADEDETPSDLPPKIPKKPLFRLPPIWAETRQEVCESFEWFRSYQGGVYFSNNLVKGYLLSAFAAHNDVFEQGGRLIISHGGGKAETTLTYKRKSYVQQAEDQKANDKSVRSLLNNYREQRPLVLIIDDKYPQFPYDLSERGVTYAVLGFYTIKNAWAEVQSAANKDGRVVRYKFAFQWCDSQGTPWWINSDEIKPSLSLTSKEDSDNRPVKKRKCRASELKPSNNINTKLCTVCPCCRLESPQVYQAWVCLSPDCARFWQMLNGKELQEPLEYNPTFLELGVQAGLAVGYDLTKPSRLDVLDEGNAKDYMPTSGFHCPKCGRLSCRYRWELWECKHCHVTSTVPDRIRTADEFWTQSAPVGDSGFILPSSGITTEGLKSCSPEDGSGQYQTFALPDGRGFIHHIRPGKTRERADQIFREYQEQAMSGELQFRRYPLRSHKCRGSLLTGYYSQNSGEPYQYVGGTDNTVPFDQAPSAVVHARSLIHDRLNLVLGKTAPFNEVLSAAYMETQKMSFHSDSEVGLGPMVAGLSLGSPAIMHFRLREKYAKKGEHKNIHATYVLRHGDVLVMDGAGIQEYYEHTVIPTNFRIAATARCINSDHR